MANSDDVDEDQSSAKLIINSLRRLRLIKSIRQVANAIHSDDVDKVRWLIEKHSELLEIEITRDGHTALTLAASVGYLDTVRELLRLKASVNSQNKVDGMTALHHAVKCKATNRDHVIEIVMELLNSSARVDTPAYVDSVGFTDGIRHTSIETPLMYAIRNENLPITELLIRYGASVNYKDELCGFTPILLATGTCNLPIISLLLAKGANVHAKSLERNNVLHWLAYGQRDSVRCLTTLIQHGAYVNEPNSKGRTPLMIAAGKSKPRMCRALLSWGASLNAKDNHQLTAYDFAVKNRSQQCIDVIEEAHMNRNRIRDKRSRVGMQR
ncbi:hypothetical protein ACOME3_010295 [Neoechinorhynchus agilis]